MSGRPDYDAGDLVVCVSEDNDRPPRALLRASAVYRVARLIGPTRAISSWGVELVGVTLGPDWEGFAAERFRKVDPLPHALTSLLVTEPVREGAPA